MANVRGQIVDKIKPAGELTLYEGHARVKNPRLSAPCKRSCAHRVPPQAIIRKVAEGDFEGADALVCKDRAPGGFCESCAYQCNEDCQGGRGGSPVDIQGIKGQKLPPAQAMEEAKRCLQCGCGISCGRCREICGEFAIGLSGTGAVHIDKDKCAACGMCFQLCPNGNIEMVNTGRRA